MPKLWCNASTRLYSTDHQHRCGVRPGHKGWHRCALCDFRWLTAIAGSESDPFRFYEGLDLYAVCDPSLGGCGHTQGQHAFGTDLAPCDEPGCDCRIFR